jgi:hypothetical protein
LPLLTLFVSDKKGYEKPPHSIEAWLNNADGLFANFNSAVNCPDSSRKVYTPFPPNG